MIQIYISSEVIQLCTTEYYFEFTSQAAFDTLLPSGPAHDPNLYNQVGHEITKIVNIHVASTPQIIENLEICYNVC